MGIYIRENIEQMEGYVPGFQPESPEAIKINSNENPYPPSPKVFEALGKLNGLSMQRYPKIFWDDFRKEAAKLHGVKEEQIICGNGADEVLSMLVRCCCDEEHGMAYPVPTYTLYPVLADIQGAPVIEVPWADEFQIPEALSKTGATLTFLCNPNAPTGTVVSNEALAKLASDVDGVLAIDEAYVDFADDNAIGLVNQFDNVIVLRTMSKGYSLAGMRFGYGIGSKKIIDAMLKVKDSYNVNVASQVAATAALADQAYFRSHIDMVVTEREKLTEALREMGFTLGNSKTNFVLTEPPKGFVAAEIHEKLAQQNIYVRYFKNDELANKLRISIGTAEQNGLLIEAIRGIIGI